MASPKDIAQQLLARQHLQLQEEVEVLKVENECLRIERDESVAMAAYAQDHTPQSINQSGVESAVVADAVRELGLDDQTVARDALTTHMHITLPLKSRTRALESELATVKLEKEDLQDQIDQAASRPTIATRRVFAIPELLEQILLSLNCHTTGPFRLSSAAGAKELCRLERVDIAFHATITGSRKLLDSRSLLSLDRTPTEYVAVTWLLRELGHTYFKIADCEAHGCIYPSASSGWRHKCNNKNYLQIKRSPGYQDAILYKRAFEKAIESDSSWRELRIAAHFKIYFTDRHESDPIWVEEHMRTLGQMWDCHKNKL